MSLSTSKARLRPAKYSSSWRRTRSTGFDARRIRGPNCRASASSARSGSASKWMRQTPWSVTPTSRSPIGVSGTTS
jgi:hypothetical protein